ncbi:rhomboid family intramembrane serine protease [Propioniciclava tarda]|uniref:Rhomboid family intramembrane serine protease n=2 Tax=Propioniciclava tarda TaxID=433330 RepID=A0A4Q9KND7_PROTD|nr:rhomboid family intramembrane serine protease [Propioniciclava tarda]
MSAWLALLWIVEAVEQVTRGSLLWLGISPRQLEDLPQIYTAPLVHLDWQHLMGNSAPFFILGLVILLSGVWRWLVSTFASLTSSGLAVWLLSPPNTVTVGISGLIFGWLTYLLTRGIFSRNWRQIALAVVVFAVYGGILWGVLPGSPGVSWLGHLGGAVGGVAAAWFLHSTSERRRRLSSQGR